ncbi:MAG TPA: HAD-IA family hydrolase [Candidatus Aenigmarchaeota archaeon]|nr:HAD-IA family hydrolase [Candidatus Aenigmarchaeota archaeon]
MKPVIFVDFGETYFCGSAKFMAKKYAKEFYMTQKQFFDILIKSGSWNLLARGKITDNEHWNKIQEMLKTTDAQIAEMRRCFHSSCKPIAGMPELVKRLRKNYKVVVLSGNNRERIEYLEKKYKLSKIFHEQHYSYHYGYDKPDPRLFAAAVKKMKLKPKDCLMIDDMSDFIRDVRKMGAQGIVFKNPKQLERDLRKTGVEI